MTTTETDHDVAAWDEWPERTLVVVACSAAKLDRPAPARQLYTGTLFTLALRAARALVDDDWIRVMSARHGLVGLDVELAPYEQRMADEGAVSVRVMRAQAERLYPQPDAVVLLTPKAYTERGRLIWPAAACPLEGALGIGEIRQRLAVIARRGIEPSDEFEGCPVTYRIGCGCRIPAPPTPALKRLVIGQLVRCETHGDRHVTAVVFHAPTAATS
jgi:hypothetical protein